MGFCRSGSTAKSNLAQSRKDAGKTPAKALTSIFL